jgi:hypothetical protein
MAAAHAYCRFRRCESEPRGALLQDEGVDDGRGPAPAPRAKATMNRAPALLMKC